MENNSKVKKETKTSLKNNASRILNSYKVNSSVTEVSDIDFLLDLFKRHHQWGTKEGVGITGEIIIRKTQYGTKCFYIKRIDGSETDISYNECLNVRKKETDLIYACRDAVTNIIREFRDKNVVYGKTTCPITNSILYEDNTHIDHFNLPFIEVYKNWIKNKNIDFLISKLNPTEKDGEVKIFFIDQEIINDFCKYHNENTNLRAVSKSANLSMPKRTI